MLRGKPPIAFVNPYIFEEGIKSAVHRVDETGPAVQKTLFEQIGANKASQSVRRSPQQSSGTTGAPQIVRALLRVVVDFAQMLAEIRIRIMKNVGLQTLRDAQRANAFVRTALPEFDTALAKHPQQTIRIPAAVEQEAIVIPGTPSYIKAADFGRGPAQCGKNGLAQFVGTDFVLIQADDPVGIHQIKGVTELGQRPLPGMRDEACAVRGGNGGCGVGAE